MSISYSSEKALEEIKNAIEIYKNEEPGSIPYEILESLKNAQVWIETIKDEISSIDERINEISGVL